MKSRPNRHLFNRTIYNGFSAKRHSVRNNHEKMGYTVYCNNQNIWNPSLNAGKYFLGSVNSLENLIGIKSGISSPLADSIEIEAEELSAFVGGLLDYIENTNNNALLTMISGIAGIILALNAKVNNEIPQVTEKNRLLVEISQRVFI